MLHPPVPDSTVSYSTSRNTDKGKNAYDAARYKYNGNSYLYRILTVFFVEICQPVRTIRQRHVEIICQPRNSIHSGLLDYPAGKGSNFILNKKENRDFFRFD
jgi:hypothetical protein